MSDLSATAGSLLHAHPSLLAAFTADTRLYDLDTPLGSNALLVAYQSTAALKCLRSLGWGLPTHTLDLYAEFRCAEK